MPCPCASDEAIPRTGQLSLAIPLRVGAMSTSQRTVMLCCWGLKDRFGSYERMWVAGKTA